MTEIKQGPDQSDLEKLPKEEVKLHATRLYNEFLDTLSSTPESINLIIKNFLWGKALSSGLGNFVEFKRGNKYYSLNIHRIRQEWQDSPSGSMDITMADNERDARYHDRDGNWVRINLGIGGFSLKSPMIKDEYGFPKWIDDTQLTLEKAEEVLTYLKAPVDTSNQELSPTKEGN